MSEEEEEQSEGMNGKMNQVIGMEDENSSDKETIASSEEIKKENEKDFEVIRYRPDVNFDLEHDRYPYCIVWSLIPVLSWIIPCIGHAGICNSEGVTADFTGTVYIGEFAFKPITKYILLKYDSREIAQLDDAINNAAKFYKTQQYHFFTNNCHSFVAKCLNNLKYKGKSNYTMVDVWWMIFTQGRFINWKRFFISYLGLFIFLSIILTIILCVTLR